jgi:hypothetical protein
VGIVLAEMLSPSSRMPLMILVTALAAVRRAAVRGALDAMEHRHAAQLRAPSRCPARTLRADVSGDPRRRSRW